MFNAAVRREDDTELKVYAIERDASFPFILK